MRALILEADSEMTEEWKSRGTRVWAHHGIVCPGKVYTKASSSRSLGGRGSETHRASFKALVRAAVDQNGPPAKKRRPRGAPQAAARRAHTTPRRGWWSGGAGGVVPAGARSRPSGDSCASDGLVDAMRTIFNMPLGGLLTGFFGGLSGHQGALRSAFLVRAGLSKEAFIATGVVIAAVVDIARLSVYSVRLKELTAVEHGPLLAAATLSAFLGAYLGNRLLPKVTLRGVQVTVAIALLFIAVGLAAGIL